MQAKQLGLESIAAASSLKADKITSQPKTLTFATQWKADEKCNRERQLQSEESNVTRALCFAPELNEEARIEGFSYECLENPSSLFELDRRERRFSLCAEDVNLISLKHSRKWLVRHGMISLEIQRRRTICWTVSQDRGVKGTKVSQMVSSWYEENDQRQFMLQIKI